MGVALGLVVGILVGRWLFRPQPEPTLPDWEGSFTLERDRALQPRDTTGQVRPDVEIRYRTRTETTRVRDTLHVPVPTKLRGGVVSDRRPVEVTPQRATWTYWDPTDRRYEQREWRVPVDRYQASVYAVGLRRWQPRPTLQAGLGVEATLSPKWLPGAIEPFGEVRAGRQIVVTTGLRWHLIEL